MFLGRVDKAGLTGMHIALAGLAVGFQLMTTITVNGSYLRVGVADLMMPFLLLAALVHWSTGKQPLPRWHLKGLPLWFMALTAWLLFELLAGRVYSGSWQKWALVNKAAGWFVLLGFFAVGAWIAQVADERGKKVFVGVLVLTAIIIGGIDLLYFLGARIISDNLYPRVEGLAGNPNSYGYLCAVIFTVALAHPDWRRCDNSSVSVALGLILVYIVYSGSRSAWVGLAFGMAVLAALRQFPTRTVIRIVGIAAIIMLTMQFVPKIIIILIEWQSPAGNDSTIYALTRLYSPYYMRDAPLMDSGVNHRLLITMHAVELWLTQPVLGVGLGSFYWHERQTAGGLAATIHNTGLWLLTETGIVGLTLFASFFILGMVALWRAHRRGELDPIAVGGIATLAVFLGASVGMEAMYQRHVWFLAGYAMLARPRTAADHHG